jgi:hypothetical protein
MSVLLWEVKRGQEQRVEKRDLMVEEVCEGVEGHGRIWVNGTDNYILVLVSMTS